MNFLKSKWFKITIIAIIIVLAFILIKMNGKEIANYRTTTIKRGNIESVVEGSGAITSSTARKIYSKVNSEVLSIDKKEGEEVKSGDVILTLDLGTFDSTVKAQEIAVKQAKLSLSNIEKQIKDLQIVANASGYVTNLMINEGSFVTNTMQICNIAESGAFEIVLPFVYTEGNKIEVGSSANVILTQNFSNIQGTVTKVGEMRKLAEASSQVVDITIKVVTSGYSLEGAMAKAEIISGGIRQASTEAKTFKAVSSNVVRAKTSGTVTKLIAYEGKFVNAGDVIAILSNDDLNLSLENAKLTLQNLQSQYDAIKDQLDNYKITSPIDGNITMQNVKVGDSVAGGMLLTTVSNRDILEFIIPIDELDIAKLNYDQEVRVSIDALPDTEKNPIIGKISKLPLEGVSTAGVTEYFVTIEFPGNEDVRISMSANAKIIISNKEDILIAPIDATYKEDGISYIDVLLPNGEIEQRKVDIGSKNITYVEIISGAIEGEKVIIKEQSKSWF